MKFRNIIALVLLFVLIGGESYGQKKIREVSNTKKLSNELKDLQKALEIKIKVLVIQLDSSLEKVSIGEVEDLFRLESDNRAVMSGYLKGDSLLRVDECVAIANLIKKKEYYFDKGKLIFINSENCSYPFDGNNKTFDSTKLQVQSSCSYYFENDKILMASCNNEASEKLSKEQLKDVFTLVKYYKQIWNKGIKR